mgnify:FL=1
MAYRSLVSQTLHYFSRPHRSVPSAPLDTAAAWRGDGIEAEGPWRQPLTPSQVSDIEQALDVAVGSGKPVTELVAADLPFQMLGPTIAEWRQEIAHGRGFVVFGGLPVQDWDEDRAERFFFGLGQHLGEPGAQNPEGHILGHVRDVGGDYRTERGYKTRASLNYHCDAADAVGLLCVQDARSGGRSRIASSTTIFNRMLAEVPDRIGRLFDPLHFDTKAEGGVRTIPIAPMAHMNGRLRTWWHSDYFRSAPRWSHLGPLDPEILALIDRFDAIAHEPGVFLEMDLQPGDVQLLSNHTVVHARTAYEDGPSKRHLLRLWLSLPGEIQPSERWARMRAKAALGGRLLVERIRQRASVADGAATTGR